MRVGPSCRLLVFCGLKFWRFFSDFARTDEKTPPLLTAIICFICYSQNLLLMRICWPAGYIVLSIISVCAEIVLPHHRTQKVEDKIYFIIMHAYVGLHVGAY